MVPALFGAGTPYDPLWLYEGHWKGTVKTGDSVSATVDLVNTCGRIGTFFGCQQTVNGKTGAVLLYVPAGPPGRYYTQVIQPEGSAAGGRGELQIEGDRWTFQSQTKLEGTTSYSRTTNVFTGKDHIHFEQSESSDGEHWVVKMSGDNARLSKGAH
jgi:hypothetical protein